jgi:4-hydroxybenzoate polyprenyltransferase
MAQERVGRFSHDQISLQTRRLPGWQTTIMLVMALRPRQWLKNGLLFVPLAFTLNLHHVDLVARTLGAFMCFCALSSAGYLLNDVKDVESDRAHPAKRSRPIASGRLSVPVALAAALALALAGLGGCFWLSPQFGGTGVAYLGMTTVYTLWMKHQVLLDVFGIAAGFVIRAAAGAVAIGVPISPWLYSATMLGALLIALGKRRADLQTLGASAARHRRNLEAYTVELVDQLIAIISGTALMTYALYTFSAENLPRDHSMMLTIPVVLYGLFRYLYLLHVRGGGGAPDELLLRDTPLLASIGVWAALAVAVLYLGSGQVAL